VGYTLEVERSDLLAKLRMSRERLSSTRAARFGATGLHDVVRDRWPDERVVTYWDYRAGMFHQDCGMRIDLVLVSEPVADRVRAAWFDRQAREGSRPSDHAPVIVDLDEAPDGDARSSRRRPLRS
jgi:exodeoxyribonuclease-3